MNRPEKLILVDADGVLLNWDYAFHTWMDRHGYSIVPGMEKKYSVAKMYNISSEQANLLVKIFNESAAIGFLPALRDSVEYVQKLHNAGFTFHVITSFGTESNAIKLRKSNLLKVFGNVFEGYTFLEGHSSKLSTLEKYQGTGLYWIEDKATNAIDGAKVGLKSLLMAHGHNWDKEHPEYTIVHNWKEIYNIVTGQ